MKDELPAQDMHVLTARDAGRIMAMLQALIAAIDELFEARKIPFEEPEKVAEHEGFFDQVEARLFEDDPLF